MRVREDRSFRHSGLQPAGIFVNKGASLVITVPSTTVGLKVNVVLYGNYSVFPDQTFGKYVEEHDLLPGENTVTAGISGFVHLVDAANEGTRTTVVSVRGGMRIPTFEKGKSNEATFRKEVATSQSRFGVLLGERVMVEIQKPILTQWLARANTNIASRISLLDDSVEETDRVFGLSRNRDLNDGAYKGPHRIHVTNPDNGAGYASATHDRITFHNAAKAMMELLTLAPTELWGFWHEVGHTYQPPIIKWSGLTEVTVNIPPCSNYERVHGKQISRLDSASNQKAISDFFAQPNITRSFDSAGLWVKLLLFDQLRRAFGEEVYARFAQEIRVDRAIGEPAPSGVPANKDMFAVTAAKVANRNLNSWLRTWGFTISNAAQTELAKRPNLGLDIAANRFRPNDSIEHLVGYSPPSGTVSAKGVARFAQRNVDIGNVTLAIIPGTGARVGRRRVDALAVGNGTGLVVVEFIASQDGQRNVRHASLNVRRGTMVEVRGVGDRFVVAIAIMDDGQIEVHGSTVVAHNYFPKHYFTASLMTSKSTVIRTASITGNENGEIFASRFSGLKAQTGQYLVVEHEEPKNRLLVWSEDVKFARSETKKQVFQIVGTTLVRSSMQL